VPRIAPRPTCLCGDVDGSGRIVPTSAARPHRNLARARKRPFPCSNNPTSPRPPQPPLERFPGFLIRAHPLPSKPTCDSAPARAYAPTATGSRLAHSRPLPGHYLLICVHLRFNPPPPAHRPHAIRVNHHFIRPYDPPRPERGRSWVGEVPIAVKHIGIERGGFCMGEIPIVPRLSAVGLRLAKSRSPLNASGHIGRHIGTRRETSDPSADNAGTPSSALGLAGRDPDFTSGPSADMPCNEPRP
jgi:hypothetical protein